MFKKNETLKTNDLERDLFETRKKLKKTLEINKLKTFIYVLLVQDQLFIKECF